MNAPTPLALLGCGLIGGSLLHAAQRQGHPVTVYDSDPATIAAIQRLGLSGVTVAASPREAVATAHLVILCAPVDQMAAVLTPALDALHPDTIVTDVGSIKEQVDREIAPLLKNRAHWIPSHPMAGREKSGFAAATETLFEGATVILTPAPTTDPDAIKKVAAFWTSLGGRVIQLTPAEHDQRIARISHLPQIVASATARAAEERDLAIAGPGFRDTTRIAASPADLWKEILTANSAAILPALDALIADLRKVRTMIAENKKTELHDWLQYGNQVRSNYRSGETTSR